MSPDIILGAPRQHIYFKILLITCKSINEMPPNTHTIQLVPITGITFSVAVSWFSLDKMCVVSRKD